MIQVVSNFSRPIVCFQMRCLAQNVTEIAQDPIIARAYSASPDPFSKILEKRPHGKKTTKVKNKGKGKR